MYKEYIRYKKCLVKNFSNVPFNLTLHLTWSKIKYFDLLYPAVLNEYLGRSINVHVGLQVHLTSFIFSVGETVKDLKLHLPTVVKLSRCFTSTNWHTCIPNLHLQPIFSRESDSTTTNVRPSFSLSVTKTPKQLLINHFPLQTSTTPLILTADHWAVVTLTVHHHHSPGPVLRQNCTVVDYVNMDDGGGRYKFLKYEMKYENFQ